MSKAQKIQKLPFKIEPLDPRFVPPKPKNSVEDERLHKLERDGREIITRKRDGHYLTIAIGKRPRLYTRGIVRDVSENFPHIIKELSKLGLPEGGTLKCGEIVKDENGSDNREFVARLTGTRSSEDAVALQREHGNAKLIVFNTLILGGKDVSGTFNGERIGRIQRIFDSTEFVRPVELLHCSIAEAEARARRKKWEGLVIYDSTKSSGYRLDGNEDSPIRPDGCWKRKPSYEDDFIVYDWVPGTAGKRHADRMGKLLIAQVHPVSGEQVPCGEVGIGFSDDMRDALANDARYPFVAEVKYERRFAPRQVKKGVIQCALCSPCFVRKRDDKSVGACRLPDDLAKALAEMKR